MTRTAQIVNRGDTLYEEMIGIDQMLYSEYGISFSAFEPNLEGRQYGACSFRLNGHKIEHRVSKITPKKVGQFVAIWKRNEQGETSPFDAADDIDFIIITSRNGNAIGQFIFPREVLIEQGVVSQNGRGGKRGIRVYPVWDKATNPQAVRTQAWQVRYFVAIKGMAQVDRLLAIQLLQETKK